MKLAPRNKVTKGRLGRLSFMYNPTSFQDNISVSYNEVKSAGISYPILAYGGGATRTVSFSVYLNDRVEKGITKKFIAELHSYIPPAGLPGHQFKAPPPIIFAFGWFVKECYLTDMNIDYSAFSPELEPIEATVNLTLTIIQ